jgi:hypothetical protein
MAATAVASRSAYLVVIYFKSNRSTFAAGTVP